MVDSSDPVCHLLGLCQVRSAFQTYRKAVKPRPPGCCPAVVLDTLLGETCRNGADYGRIQTAAEENSIRHVRHELSPYRGNEGLPELFHIGGIVLYIVILKPVTLVPGSHFSIPAPVIMTWQERLVLIAESLQGLELAADIDGAVLVAADIKRNDSYRITGNEIGILLAVIQGKCVNAVEIFEKVNALLLVKSQDNLAVRAGLKLVLT